MKIKNTDPVGATLIPRHIFKIRFPIC